MKHLSKVNESLLSGIESLLYLIKIESTRVFQESELFLFFLLLFIYLKDHAFNFKLFFLFMLFNLKDSAKIIFKWLLFENCLNEVLILIIAVVGQKSSFSYSSSTGGGGKKFTPTLKPDSSLTTSVVCESDLEYEKNRASLLEKELANLKMKFRLFILNIN